MDLHIGISEKNRQEISLGLARMHADTYAVYLKTQNFHWNLTGPEFYSLHLLFEKQYEEMAGAIDEIAERIRTLGYFVEASFGALKKMTGVKEEERVLNIKEMLLSLIEAHESLICHARKVAEIADNEKDFATVDMIGRRLGAHEKFTWMLRSQMWSLIFN